MVAVARLAAPPGPGADYAEPTGRLTLWLAHPAAPLEKALARVRRTLALNLLGAHIRPRHRGLQLRRRAHPECAQ
ncbi:MAG: hypothetical protein M3Y12_14870, partial [Bacteroidota bacterium]|nr:hypothetical protein [Bacteroidota bacterium]